MAPMTPAQRQPVLDAVLDSWDRSNVVLINLLRAILKAAGCPIADADAGPLTWDVWRAR